MGATVRPLGLDPGAQMGALFGCPSRKPRLQVVERLVGPGRRF